MAGSFLAREWPEKLKKAIGNRINIIPNGYQEWTHGRQPFIRVTSNVKINGDTTLREKFQLFSGNLRGLKSSYDLNNRNEPFPGVTSLSIKDTGSQGALRKIQYNFQCWSLEQLKAHEALYMSLGTFQCVEWGWTTKPNGSRVTSKMPLGKQGMLGSMSDFYSTVRRFSAAEDFCYDAAKGKVSNFNWAINEVGGFDCMVELTSMGNILLEAPTKTSSVSNGCQDADDKKNEDAVVDTKRPNPKTIFSFLYETMEAGQIFAGANYQNQRRFFGTSIKFDKDISDEEKEKDKDEQAFNAEEDYYITWDFFEEKIINNLLFPKLGPDGTKEKDNEAYKSNVETTGNEKAWPKIVNAARKLPQSDYWVQRSNNGIGCLDSRGTLLPNFENDLISSNPGVCLLPNQEHWRKYEDGSHEYKNGFAAASATLATVAAGTAATGAVPVALAAGGLSLICGAVAYFMDDPNVNEGSLEGLDKAISNGLKFAVPGDPLSGVLSAILLNVRHLEKSLDESDTVAEYVQKILDDISAACANQFDMQVVEDPDNPSILRIVESGTVDTSATEKVVVFPSMGPNSVVRNVNVETKLSGKIAAQVMYGTNRKADSHDMGDDGSAGEFSFWNAQVVDMDYENIKMIDALRKNTECCKNAQNGPLSREEVIKSIFAAYQDARIELAESVGAEAIEAANTATKKKIELLVAGKADTTDGGKQVPINLNAIDAVLPIDLSFSLDGIAGVKWGLPVSLTYLPERYRGAYFTIVGVDHTIDTGGWITDISTVMRGNSGAVGSTGFPQPAPSEAEATGEVRQAPIPPTPPPPPEEQPVPSQEQEEEPVVEQEQEEEEQVESRHVDQEEAGTDGMIVYSGKFVFGEQGGGLLERNRAIPAVDRTRTFRLIQMKQNNIYRIEVDGHYMKIKGRVSDRNYVVDGPGIYGFNRVTRSNDYGDQRITTKAPHGEKELQELINDCLDNTQNDGPAREIWSAIRGELGRMPGLGFTGPQGGLRSWTRPGAPQSGGRYGNISSGEDGIYRRGYNDSDYRV